MKILKYILIGLVTVAILFVILGLIVPKEYKVERTVSINAPDYVVMDHLRHLKKTDAWSPWADYDPNMVHSYNGKDGAPGASATWEGNKEVGKGSQELILVEPNRVESTVTFIEPWESTSNSYFQLSPEGETTNVAWGFSGVNPFPWNVMTLFMNMDEMLGKDFERGLNKLKENTESLAAKWKVEEVQWPGKKFVGKRAEMSMDEIQSFFTHHYGELYPGLEKAKVVPGFPAGIYYTWDEENGTTDLAVAVAVETEKVNIKDYDIIEVPSAKALKITYKGAYEQMMPAYETVDAYLWQRNIDFNGIVVEEYVSGPGTEADTSQWVTDIYFVFQ
ncbi:MAG: GyrI-like domain-containing protein [Cyclobacteriaceae bacterium]